MLPVNMFDKVLRRKSVHSLCSSLPAQACTLASFPQQFQHASVSVLAQTKTDVYLEVAKSEAF